MTPLPKRRPSRQRQGKRRSTHRITIPNLMVCPQCKSLKKPFTVCAKCGYYNGKQVGPVKKVKKNEKPA
ncbi:50S ribosomal protein L32 [Candidatus Gottesmanbacteria bacterium]|nr:50S ribosomal protein L32 [Candidatus Gottesmanbacteria bacterium]